MNYPDRSPLILAEVIQPIIQDKIVCDVGCGQGDLMVEFSKYAKHVIGVDYMEYWEIDNPNLDIIHENIYQLNKFPKADVYHIWIAPKDIDAAISRIEKGIIILGDYGKSNLKKYSDYIIKFPFTDSGMSDWWTLQIIKK